MLFASDLRKNSIKDLKGKLSEEQIRLNRRNLKLICLIELVIFIFVIIVAIVEKFEDFAHLFFHIPYLLSVLLVLLLSCKWAFFAKYSPIFVILIIFPFVLDEFNLFGYKHFHNHSDFYSQSSVEM